MNRTVVFFSTTTCSTGSEIALFDLLRLKLFNQLSVYPNFGEIVGKLDSVGVDVAILDKSSSTQIEISRRDPMWMLLPLVLSIIKISLKLKLLLKSVNPKIFVTNDLKALIISKSAYVNSCAKIHYMHELCDKSYGDRYYKLTCWALNSVDLIICNSKSTKKSLRDAGILKPKLFVVNQYFELNAYAINTREQVAIGVVSRINRHKRIDLVVEVIKTLKDTYGICPIVYVYGDCVTRDDTIYHVELLDKIRSYGLQEKILLLGSYSTLQSAYDRFDILISASEIESFGRVVVEGMINRKCVIASNISAYSEIIKDSVTGYLADFKNIQAISNIVYKLMIDEGLRTRISFAAQEFAIENFCKKQFVKDIVEIVNGYTKN